MKTNLEEAKELFESHLELVEKYDISSYNLYDDEALITSTRHNAVSITWNGKQVRELVGPSVENAKAMNRQYNFKDIKYVEDGQNIKITGSFDPNTLGQSGDFTAVIGYNKNDELKILEFHDGQPPENKIRVDEVIIEEE